MTIKATVDRIEGDKAILKIPDGQTVVWPKASLPEELREGMVLVFEVLSHEEFEKKDKQKAKEILNEILDINQ